jgi:hypothetical protein
MFRCYIIFSFMIKKEPATFFDRGTGWRLSSSLRRGFLSIGGGPTVKKRRLCRSGICALRVQRSLPEDRVSGAERRQSFFSDACFFKKTGHFSLPVS